MTETTATSTATADSRPRTVRVARLSVATAITLGVLKTAAVVLTGSLGIVAALVDSFMDVVASSVNLFAVGYALRPPDAEHRYGHGKVEGLAGLLQSLVIAGVGAFLVVEGTQRALHADVPIARTTVGIAVMVFSLLASIWIAGLLKRTARETGSVVLEADAAHYASDVWSNGGVLLALILMGWTGWWWVDGVVAVLAGAIVLYSAWRVLRKSVVELLDTALPEEEHARLRTAVERDVPEVREIHRFRSRRSGPNTFVDLHVAFDRDLSFVEAHRLSERVRIAIEAARPGTFVHVHADPYPFLETDLP